jgi:hypothetical protein
MIPDDPKLKREGIMMVRAISLVFAMGAIMTATEAEAGQEKKEEEPPKAPYTQWMSVRAWAANDKKFLNPHNNTPAMWPKDNKGEPRKDKDGSQWIILGHGVDSATGPKSELTDRAGKVFVVVRVVDRGTGSTTLTIIPKPEQKK